MGHGRKERREKERGEREKEEEEVKLSAVGGDPKDRQGKREKEMNLTVNNKSEDVFFNLFLFVVFKCFVLFQFRPQLIVVFVQRRLWGKAQLLS